MQVDIKFGKNRKLKEKISSETILKCFLLFNAFFFNVSVELLWKLYVGYCLSESIQEDKLHTWDWLQQMWKIYQQAVPLEYLWVMYTDHWSYIHYTYLYDNCCNIFTQHRCLLHMKEYLGVGMHLKENDWLSDNTGLTVCESVFYTPHEVF